MDTSTNLSSSELGSLLFPPRRSKYTRTLVLRVLTCISALLKKVWADWIEDVLTKFNPTFLSGRELSLAFLIKNICTFA